MANSVVQPGDKASTFKLKFRTGEAFNLADYKGKRVVLHFYPRADAPGCTNEAHGSAVDPGQAKQLLKEKRAGK